jgi:peptidoglycan hydrolase CwlO-like protein
MKNVNLDNILLVASFLGIAYSPFYVVVFIALLAKHAVIIVNNRIDRDATDKKLKEELAKVQAVSAQIEELQNSINNVRAAVSLGNRR